MFISAAPADKLDATDAQFVDVIHSNAFVQGQIERCGTVDFYMNGGIAQPGCFAYGSSMFLFILVLNKMAASSTKLYFHLNTDPFACSHHRAADYYTESIQSERGFWGWPCNSYYSYLLGMCPRTNELHLAGEDCRDTTRGMFLITTNSEAPFASGQWTLQSPPSSNKRRDPFLEIIDSYGKLESAFNYVDGYVKSSFGSVYPLEENSLLNHIIHNEYDQEKYKQINLVDQKFGITTERWRKNDKFILVEEPSVVDINRSLMQNQQLSSSDELRFPKIS